MKGVYEATRRLCSEGTNTVQMLKSKGGRQLTKDVEVKAWHTQGPEVTAEVKETDGETDERQH